MSVATRPSVFQIIGLLRADIKVYAGSMPFGVYAFVFSFIASDILMLCCDSNCSFNLLRNKWLSRDETPGYIRQERRAVMFSMIRGR